jgi:hypothetical protein
MAAQQRWLCSSLRVTTGVWVGAAHIILTADFNVLSQLIQDGAGLHVCMGADMSRPLACCGWHLGRVPFLQAFCFAKPDMVMAWPSQNRLPLYERMRG